MERGALIVKHVEGSTTTVYDAILLFMSRSVPSSKQSLDDHALTRATLRSFLHAMKPESFLWLAQILFICVGFSMDISVQARIGALVDEVNRRGVAQIPSSEWMRWAGTILVMYTVYWGSRRVYAYLAIYAQLAAMKRLENQATSYLLRHSFDFFANQFAGSLVKRVNRFSRSFMDIADAWGYVLFPMLAALTWMLLLAWHRSPPIALAVLGWFLVLAAYNYWSSRRIQSLRLERAKKDSEVTGYLSDTMTNISSVQQFAGITREQAAIARLIGERIDLHARVWRAGEMTFTMQNVLMVFVEAIFLYFGIQGLRSATLTIGDFLFLQTALGTLFNRTWDLSRVIRVWHEAMAEAKEMVEILERPLGIVDRVDAKSLVVKKGEIIFDNVRFRYGSSSAVLNNVDLSIRPGEKVALVGPSGAGKSTIVKVLFRFYDLTKGRILIDGQDIANVTQDSLRASLSLVPQEPILFHRSLKENIRYGCPRATDKDIIKAAKQAHCHEFIAALEKGYDTYVGERGVKLSGGERQRVAIARAILKNAPILVLDEATSSLDSESEHLIQDALKHLMKDKTVIVIAHRLSTIMQMDRIVVLEDGAIADVGTHQELLQTEGGLYRKLWELQAGGFLAA